MYDKVRRDVLSSVSCPNLRELLVGGGLPSKDNLRGAASSARCIPKAPESHDDILLDDIPYKQHTADHYLLRRCSMPCENGDIILMGTPRTVRQFVCSKFKSGDATFSCAPKLFYQVTFLHLPLPDWNAVYL